MKKRTIFICSLLMVACSCTFAQQSPNFQYSLYDVVLNYSSYSAIPLKDTGYAVLYTTYNNSTYSLYTYLEWLDNHGNVTGSPVVIGDTAYTNGYSVKQTADSGFIITGIEYSSTSYYNYAFLIKTNKSGVQQWVKYYSPAPNVTSGYDVAITNDGGYVLTGYTENYYSMGESQIYVARTDSKGDTLWTRTYGDTTNQGFANSVRTTTDGGFIITGSQLNGTNKQDIYVLKVDSNGNKQWGNYFGGPNDDIGNFGAQTNDGGYIFAGARALDTSDAKSQSYIIKTNSSGDSAWTYLDTNFSSEAYGVVQTPGGQYVVAGFDSVGANDSVFQPQTDAYLFKLSSAGKRMWSANPYGSTYVLFSQFTGITQTADGGFFMPGMGDVYDFNNNAYGAVIAVKTDSNGNISQTATAINQTPRSNPDIIVYPNPFSSQTAINVSNTNLQNAVLSIYDMNGNVVRQVDNINSGLITIDRANLNSGMYFYRLINDNGVIGTGKFVAE